MTSDFRKLPVFIEADRLAIAMYPFTAALPDCEQYGLQSQLRRLAVSVACNIVEASSRTATLDYLGFLHHARVSARECAYLLGLINRLGLLADQTETVRMVAQYEDLQAGLLAEARALNC